jgi:hypothetical protein
MSPLLPHEQTAVIFNPMIEKFQESNHEGRIRAIQEFQQLLLTNSASLGELHKKKYSHILVEWALNGNAYEGCEALVSLVQCMNDQNFAATLSTVGEKYYREICDKAVNPIVRDEANDTLKNGWPDYYYQKMRNASGNDNRMS